MRTDVLLVEDNAGDVRLTKELFREVNTLVDLHVASDGIDAMAFLRREGVHVYAPRPDIVLLDLNLPKMDGCEVLFQIKNDDSLKAIPVIVMSMSDAKRDVERCYQFQANCVLTKPVLLAEFESMVRSINDFWVTKVTLPLEIAIQISNSDSAVVSPR
jgi:two-component system, chemotaxis family, response regulator Rcp1